MFKDTFDPAVEGRPQGGEISPILANIALDGLGAALARAFKPGRSFVGLGANGGRIHRTGINVVRYADDRAAFEADRRRSERD